MLSYLRLVLPDAPLPSGRGCERFTAVAVNCAIFCVVTSYRSEKPIFRRNVYQPSSGPRRRTRRKQQEAASSHMIHGNTLRFPNYTALQPRGN
jgi:hypothetical protein